ncbi:Mitochondrial intermediate peptidase [Trichostrongylus colubriformis]|uniref:Mitochondrial intermediate peptidase n=1 Tax=Trichostrongylus colubriformis TaxID=6319 RepID=A0AAN8GE70_TRICO
MKALGSTRCRSSCSLILPIINSNSVTIVTQIPATNVFIKKSAPWRFYSFFKGLFGDPQLKSAASLAELNGRVRAECIDLLKQIETGSKERTTVQLFDDLSNTICKAADMVECVRQLHSDPAYNEAAQKSASDYCELVESLNTHTQLYHKLKNSKETEADRLDDVDKHTIDLFLNEFEQSGVHLPEKERAEFVRLSGEIFDASVKFQMGCDKEVDVGRAFKYQYGLESARITSPISNSVSQSKRRFIHTTYYRHNDVQEENLRNLVLHRDQLARLTGYPSYAHRAQENSLLGSYENAHDFLWGVIQTCRPSAERELAVLLDIQSQCNSLCSGVGEWDIHYLTQIYKERAYGVDHHHELSKFLNLGNLLTGLANLLNKLYGVRIEERRVERGEIWDGNIIKLDVISSEDRFLGTVYLDIDRRPTKAVGDCHFTVRCSKQLKDNSWQTPIVVLSLAICEQTDVDWRSIPVDMHRAENVFHEMGHAMHSMLGRTRYQHVAGTRCPQDFSEIPSILMEYFFNDLTALPHLDRQEDSAFQHRFHHLVQYGAKYYSYMVARSAATLIWNSKFRDSPFNRTEGERWMMVCVPGVRDIT